MQPVRSRTVAMPRYRRGSSLVQIALFNDEGGDCGQWSVNTGGATSLPNFTRAASAPIQLSSAVRHLRWNRGCLGCCQPFPFPITRTPPNHAPDHPHVTKYISPGADTSRPSTSSTSSQPTKPDPCPTNGYGSDTVGTPGPDV